MASEETPLVDKPNGGLDGSMASEETPLVDKPNGGLDGPAASAIIYLIAFSLGSQGISVLAAQYFLKDTLHLGPAEAAFYYGFQSLGWVVKPVWGIITDSFPIFGQRRKPYLILVSGIGALSFLAYGYVQSIWEFVSILILTNSCLAFLTVIAQALMVQRSGDKDYKVASFNFSTYFGLKILAFSCLTYAAGWMLDFSSPRRVLMTGAALLILNLLVAPFITEPPVPVVSSIRDQCVSIGKLFKRQEVWSVALYIFAVCAMPSPTSAMFYFNVDVLRFNPEFIAIISICGSVASVIGLVVYHTMLTGVPIRKLFLVATLLCTIVSATPLIQVFRLNRKWGIDDHVFALVDTFFITAVAEVLWIPMYVLASRLCPPSVEGTTYALFLSIHNLGLWVQGVSSGFLTHLLGISREDLGNLWILIVICSVFTLAPMTLLPLLPTADPEILRETTAADKPCNPQDSC